jgi:AraC family ethanolamine operon transcriptional activator
MLFYSSSFQDIDLLRDSVVKWNLEMFPLEAGSVDYKIKQAVTSNFMIGEGDFSCRTEQRGATPLGFRTFVIPANDSVQYCWRGRHLHGNCLSLFPENGELHSISNHTFHVYTISFHQSLVNAECNILGSKRLEDSIKGEKVWEIEKNTMGLIRELARNIILQSSLNKSTCYLQQRLLREILLIIRDSEERRPLPMQLKKHKILKKATDWMRERTIQPAPLSQLYQELSVSERAAQIAFKDQFGVSMKTYYKNYRLLRIHEGLKKSDPTTTVGDVAASFGYWHLGQFSKDYKNVIGELPSTTLNRGNTKACLKQKNGSY